VIRHQAPLALGAAALASLVLIPATVRAQPEPSFRSTCADLRSAIGELGRTDEELITIEVVGPLTGVEFDGTLAYLTMCAPPDPAVLCVTYGTGGLDVGDVTALSGSFSQRGPDHVLLDPCLSSPP
jgi:hypothetical protein